MKFLINDQLVKGYVLGASYATFSEETLISEMFTAPYGIFYKEGELDVQNLKDNFTEAFVEDGVLKLK